MSPLGLLPAQGNGECSISGAKKRYMEVKVAAPHPSTRSILLVPCLLRLLRPVWAEKVTEVTEMEKRIPWEGSVVRNTDKNL